MRWEKDERLFWESVWVLVCTLTSHFDAKETKLGQEKHYGKKLFRER